VVLQQHRAVGAKRLGDAMGHAVVADEVDRVRIDADGVVEKRRRLAIGFAAQRLIELEVGALTGAAPGERSAPYNQSTDAPWRSSSSASEEPRHQDAGSYIEPGVTTSFPRGHSRRHGLALRPPAVVSDGRSPFEGTSDASLRKYPSRQIWPSTRRYWRR